MKRVVSCHPGILKYFTNKSDLDVSSLITCAPRGECAAFTLLTELPRWTSRARNGVSNGLLAFFLPWCCLALAAGSVDAWSLVERSQQATFLTIDRIYYG